MPPLSHPTSNAALSTSSSLIRRASSSIATTTATFLSFLKRQTTTIIPADYSNIDSSQSPGAIIGIVFGSVAAFLLVLWLISVFMGGNLVIGASSDTSSVVIRERKRSSRRGSSRRGSSRRESIEVREVREVRRERPVPVVERIVVEERRESRPAPTVTVESSIGSEDEVVVIEEHSPPRRASGSKRVKETREVRESGYRTVDPLAYGGGVEPLRDVDRRGSRRSNR